MNENVDKHIEALVDKAMKKSVLETPSFDFTSTVMSQVAAVKQTALTTYKPLISKRVWVIVFVSVILYIAYAFWFSKPITSDCFGSINLNVFNTTKISNFFSSIHLSKTASYSIVLFAFMLLVQIPFLKHYFDKRILS